MDPKCQILSTKTPYPPPSHPCKARQIARNALHGAKHNGRTGPPPGPERAGEGGPPGMARTLLSNPFAKTDVVFIQRGAGPWLGRISNS